MPHVSLVKNTHNFFYNKAITTKKKANGCCCSVRVCEKKLIKRHLFVSDASLAVLFMCVYNSTHLSDIKYV